MSAPVPAPPPGPGSDDEQPRWQRVAVPVAVAVVLVLLAVGLVLRPWERDPGAAPTGGTAPTAPTSGPSDAGPTDETGQSPDAQDPDAQPDGLDEDLGRQLRQKLRRQLENQGPVPVTGEIGVAQANIPMRSGPSGFASSMPRVLSTAPDFVTLNEQFGRSVETIEAASPGYSAYRSAEPASGPGSSQVNGNVVLWRDDTWTFVDGGRVKIVEDDRAFYSGKPAIWDRFVTWALLERKSDGAVVSVLSTHQMTNPAKFPKQHGDPPLSRSAQYGRGMDVLVGLIDTLQKSGPVFLGGDMNTFAGYTGMPWSAAAKMRGAGYSWFDHNVDFVFFPSCQGVTMTGSSSGSMASDHDWIAARFAMNGAGPEPC